MLSRDRAASVADTPAAGASRSREARRAAGQGARRGAGGGSRGGSHGDARRGLGGIYCLGNDLSPLAPRRRARNTPPGPAPGRRAARAVLRWAAMHAIAFGAKRVFHSFLRVTRRPLRLWPGLTAARFDLLSAFLEGEYRRPSRIELRQSDLRRMLGVCASVVSRMLRALYELGWVARRRDSEDRRTWTLALTPSGETVIRSARRLLLRAVERIVNDALEPPRRRGQGHLFADLFAFTGYLDGIRYDFADRATLEYLWWPTLFDH